MAQELSYGSDDGLALFVVALNSRAFKAAIALWLLPLVTGISIFGLWVLFRIEMLEVLGFFTLLIGTVMAMVGALTLITFVIANWRHSLTPGRLVVVPALLLIGLIASNFAAAAAVMQAVEWINVHFPRHH